jgi:cytochrome c-type biogenesis protein
MDLEVPIAGAVLAGLLSFLSPCVLPLVPPYLCFLAGASLEELTASGEGARTPLARILGSAVAFVVGFSVVFVTLGAAASAAGQWLRDYKAPLGYLAGALIILMGLHFLGLLRIPLLEREARYHHAERPAGLLGAFAIGLAFAFGWTPCIGPVLGAILSVAASGDSVGRGAFLLAVYSAGLGLPFLAAAFAMRPFLGLMRRFRRHVASVERIMGGMLVATGVLFLTGTITELSYWLLETFPALGALG